MSVPSDKLAEVSRLSYTKADDMDDTHPASAGPKANGIPVLRVEFIYEGSAYTHDIPNGEFRFDNPTLQFLAFLGMKPSDIDGTHHELGTHIVAPVVRDGEDSYALSNEALEAGVEALDHVMWIETPDIDEDDESDESAPHSSGGGGGDDDGGSPTRGSADEIEEVELPDGVGVENEADERGLTVNVN